MSLTFGALKELFQMLFAPVPAGSQGFGRDQRCESTIQRLFFQ